MRRRGLKMRETFSPLWVDRFTRTATRTGDDSNSHSFSVLVAVLVHRKVRQYDQVAVSKAEHYGTIFLTAGRWSSDGMICSIPEKGNATNYGEVAVIGSRTGHLNLSKSRGLECPSEVRV